MDETTLLTAVVCLLIGLAVGFLLTRALSPGEKKHRELEAQLHVRENELKSYQLDVADHLIKTSELLQEINRNQRQLGEELAAGAARLASPEVSRKVEDTAFAGLDAGTRPNILSATPQEPPKDYAPGGGVLSEDYGWKESEETGTTRGLETVREASARDETAAGKKKPGEMKIAGESPEEKDHPRQVP